jgi:hypothetical protein
VHPQAARLETPAALPAGEREVLRAAPRELDQEVVLVVALADHPAAAEVDRAAALRAVALELDREVVLVVALADHPAAGPVAIVAVASLVLAVLAALERVLADQVAAVRVAILVVRPGVAVLAARQAVDPVQAAPATRAMALADHPAAVEREVDRGAPVAAQADPAMVQAGPVDPAARAAAQAPAVRSAPVPMANAVMRQIL